MVADEIVRLEEKADAAAGLLADDSLLLGICRPGKQQRRPSAFWATRTQRLPPPRSLFSTSSNPSTST